MENQSSESLLKPSGKCYVCGSSNWWQRSDGTWLCNRCHPNPNPGSDIEPSSNEVKYSPEVLALRDRVIKGNEKLFLAWKQIRELVNDKEEWSRQMDQFSEAAKKLRGLCTELKFKGYEDCLYIEKGKRMRSCLSNPDGFWCQVCPSTRKYWEEEFKEL